MPMVASEGETDLSLTNTNREATGTSRPLALRDLRFAGTVAAGLVAGVLGVGALSAPLLGWTDWPDALQPGGNQRQPVVMSAPDQRPATAQPPRSPARTATGPSAVPGVGTATAVVIPVGGVTGGTGGTGTGGSTPTTTRTV